MAASKIILQLLIWIPVKIRKNKTEKIALLRFYRGVENKAAFTIATPTKFENAALFLQLGLPSTLIHHAKRSFLSAVRPTVHINPSRKRSFSKTLFKPEESVENAGFSFSYWRKPIWKKELFKNDGVQNI